MWILQLPLRTWLQLAEFPLFYSMLSLPIRFMYCQNNSMFLVNYFDEMEKNDLMNKYYAESKLDSFSPKQLPKWDS